jgi:hypothetical protein
MSVCVGIGCDNVGSYLIGELLVNALPYNELLQIVTDLIAGGIQ